MLQMEFPRGVCIIPFSTVGEIDNLREKERAGYRNYEKVIGFSRGSLEILMDKKQALLVPPFKGAKETKISKLMSKILNKVHCQFSPPPPPNNNN